MGTRSALLLLLLRPTHFYVKHLKQEKKKYVLDMQVDSSSIIIGGFHVTVFCNVDVTSCFSFLFIEIKIHRTWNSPGWKEPWNVIWPNLVWEREPRWDFLAPGLVTSQKPPRKWAPPHPWGGRSSSEWLFSLWEISFLYWDEHSASTTCTHCSFQKESRISITTILLTISSSDTRLVLSAWIMSGRRL